MEQQYLNYTTIEGWDGSLGGIGNDGSDPLFVDTDGPDNVPGTEDDNLRLGTGSPAIDSGDSSALPMDAYDIDGDGNTTENLPIDLDGNPRFVDNPNAPNTGPDEPPVDRGPCENSLAEAVWIAGAGGSFPNPANWQGGVVPNNITRAFFDDRAGGTNLSYTMTFPSNQTAYACNVLANQVSLNLYSGGSQAGNFALAAPGNDPEPALLVGNVPGLDTRLIMLYSGTTGAVKTMSFSDAVLADMPGSIGQLTVRTQRAIIQSTRGSDPNSPAFVDVGKAGDGTLTVEQRGTANLEGMRVGLQSGSQGTLTVVGQTTGPNVYSSKLTYGGGGTQFIVGDAGLGIVTFGGSAPLGPADVSAGDTTDPVDAVILGHQAGSSGTVTLREAGTPWSNTGGEFVIGHAGNGTLHILDGAQLVTSTTGQVILARHAGSIAEVVIGAGASWVESVQSVQVSGDGAATLTVQPGGELIFGEGLGLNVNPAGALLGGGTIVGDVFAVGQVEPDGGTALTRTAPVPGTLTINGNYQQIGVVPGGGNESGSLVIDVAGKTSGQYDHLAIGGTAELGGGLFVNLLNGYQPEPNVPFDLPILSATGGLVGGKHFDVAFFPGITGNRFMNLAYPGLRSGDVQIVVLPLPGDINFHDPQTASVPGVPNAIAVGDFDGDGRDDLVVTVPGEPNEPGSAVVLLTRFVEGAYAPEATSYAMGLEPSALAVGEFDDQPGLDIAVANAHSDDVRVLTNTGSGGAFNPVTPATTFAVGHEPRGLQAADFDLDGHPDLAIANHGDNSVRILLGAGGTSLFELWSGVLDGGDGPSVFTVDPFDPDNDDDPDIAVTNEGGALTLLVNLVQGGRQLQFLPPVQLPVGAGVVQLRAGNPTNESGRPSLVTANYTAGTCSVLVNTTTTPDEVQFAPAVDLPLRENPTGSEPRSLALLDLDQDGDLDIAVVAKNEQDVVVARVLRNDLSGGQLAFAPATDLEAGTDPVAVAAGDINGDGKDDLIAVGGSVGRDGRSAGDVVIRLNSPPPPLPGDLDGDYDIDMDDANLLGACLSGPEIPSSLDCSGADLDTDQDVDLQDFSGFQTVFNPPR